MKHYHHLCIVALTGTLFACGGGGGSAPSAGAAVTPSSSSSSTSSGGQVIITPPTSTETFAQALAKTDSPLRSQSVALQGRENTSGESGFKTETQTLTITPVEQGGTITGYTLNLRNTNFTTSATNDAKTLTTGTTTLTSLDGNWNATLSGSDASTFSYLRRFEEQRRATTGDTTTTNIRYGVFGLQTDVATNSIQQILTTAGAPETGANTTVSYNGTVNGHFSTEGTTPIRNDYSRSTKIDVNVADGSVKVTLGAIAGASGFDTLALTGRGSISGNGFSVTTTNLTFDKTSAVCTAENNNCPTSFLKPGDSNSNVLSGTFYGDKAQEIGGTVNYAERDLDGDFRFVAGAFGARRNALANEN